jgi:hypothetical protein
MGNRASSLWKNASLLSEQFIPVVLDGSVDKRGDQVSRFFKQVSKHFANDMAVITPNAELLAHGLEDGLKKWKEIPREQRTTLADFGEYNASLDPAPPAGGVRFKVFARGFVRSPAGSLEIYKTQVTRSFEAGRDHLWLTAEEAKALAPPEARAGGVHKVPDAVVDRISRTCLIDLVRVGGNGGPRKAEDVLSQEMALTVKTASAEELRLQISGSTRVTTRDPGSGARAGEPKVDEYRFSGEAVYDRTRQTFVRFDVVAFSETGHYDEIAKKILPLGVALELTASDAPADRLPPSSYGPAYFKGTSKKD